LGFRNGLCFQIAQFERETEEKYADGLKRELNGRGEKIVIPWQIIHKIKYSHPFARKTNLYLIF